jgi:pilus assembly protein Flp/PilA
MSRLSFSRLRRDERGQGLLEYALILALVAIVVILGLAALGVDIEGLVKSVSDEFD